MDLEQDGEAPGKVAGPAGARPRVWVTATFTADSLRAPLELWGELLGLDMDVRLAPYAQLFQQLLDPGSGLRRNRHGANVLLLRWDDLAGPLPAADAEANAEQAFTDKVRRLAAELGHAVSGAALSVPSLLLLAPSASDTSERTRQVLAQVEGDLRLSLTAVPGVTVIDAGQVARRYPVAAWADPESDRLGHIPFTGEYFAALSATIARWYQSIASPPRKVLVLDCDNTLWRGVVGEDGPLGVHVDGPYREIQSFVVAQADSGRLICLASKNEEADVREVFARRDDMPLDWRRIVAHRIGWGPKSAAIRELAAELGLGLDSFVFLDDSPVECAEVRAHCPEVVTLELPADPGGIPDFLAHAWPLDVGRVTDEDRRRSRMYADNAERSRRRRDAPSLATFLTGLDLRVEIRPAGANDVARVAQLTERTNQFNAQLTRLGEAAVAARIAGDESPVFVVTAADRFGAYGTVGVVSGRFEGDTVIADTFLLSCRALGRGVEHRMLAHLGALGVARGCQEIAVAFRPSARNTPARRFLEGVFATSGADAPTVFRMPAVQAARIEFDPSVEGAGDTATEESEGTGGAGVGASRSETFQHIADHLTTARAVVDALARRVRPRPDLPETYVEPRDGVERIVAGAWQEVLRVDRVGARDGFRQLGGQSFELVRIRRLLLDRLRRQLDITTLFQYPTVAELAAFLEREAAPAGGRSAVADRAGRMRAALARHAAASQSSSTQHRSTNVRKERHEQSRG